MTARQEHDREIYLAGFQAFNAGAYHAAHEQWEDLWLRNRSPARPFFQGLIQVAAAYYHQESGRERPFMVLLREAAGRLGPYAPRYLGLEVAPLLVALQRAEAHAGRADPAPRMVVSPPDMEMFAPHAGSAPGPAAKQDWLWQGEEAPDD